MIKFDNFSKSHRNFVAVQEVSFTAQAGTATVLLGANGAGKTTLLRACAGLHYASSGQVLVSAENQGDFSASQTFFDVAQKPSLAKKLVGFAPEKPLLYDDMTVWEFISASAQLRGVTKNNLQAAVSSALSQCDLLEAATQKIKTLSKGYKQRVSLAAVLAFDPPNIVLDEPASGLDPTQISSLRKLISELAHKKTVLLSTHLISEAVALKPHILIMHHGTIAVSGTEQEICQKAQALCESKASAKIQSLEEAFIFFTNRGV